MAAGHDQAVFLPEGQVRYTDSQFETIKRIETLSKEKAVDFIVVVGDIFEHHFPAKSIQIRFLDAIKSVDVPIYLLPENHDLYNSSSIWKFFIDNNSLPENVTVLTEAKSYFLTDKNVEILAVPRFSKASTYDPVGSFLESVGPKESQYRILLAHG